jgi:hypothetical protein
MESRSLEGERPVSENRKSPSGTLSNAMHVKLRVNPSRPRDKAKYNLVTDSGQVPRGKGETEPATVCRQGVRAPQGVMACLLLNESASYCLWHAEGLLVRRRSESESEMGEHSRRQ